MDTCSECTSKGTEKNPLGLGVCAKHHDAGFEHVGKDGHMYTVRVDKINRHTWQKLSKKRTIEEVDNTTPTSENKDSELNDTEKENPGTEQSSENNDANIIDPSQDIVDQAN